MGGPLRLRVETRIPRVWTPDSMTTRSATLITIALLSGLLAFVALAALFAGDISERAGTIVTTVLGSFATVLAGLLLFLRVETINTKVDDAANHASAAAEKADRAAKMTETVHQDMLNGGLRENVKKAISEDRHYLRNRMAAEYAREQLEARGQPRRRDPQEGED